MPTPVASIRRSGCPRSRRWSELRSAMKTLKFGLVVILVLAATEGSQQSTADSQGQVGSRKSEVGSSEGDPSQGIFPDVEMNQPRERIQIENDLAQTGPGHPEPPRPQGPLFERYVVEANPCPEPSAQEIEGEFQSRAGSTARFYLQGSRVVESEAYRSELRGLP